MDEMTGSRRIEADRIMFGLSREEDERSLADFLSLFADRKMTSVLIPRLTDEEIERLVTHLSDILRSRLNKSEYHALFLGHNK